MQGFPVMKRIVLFIVTNLAVLLVLTMPWTRVRVTMSPLATCVIS